MLAIFEQIKSQLRQLACLPFISIIMLINIAIFIYFKIDGLNAIQALFLPNDLSTLMQSMAIWRIITPCFVHYTEMHLLTNLFTWWYFGAIIERRSSRLLLVLFFATAIVGNLAQWMFKSALFGGLSGVVYGLVGYLLCHHFYAKTTPFQLDRSILVIMLLLLPISASGFIGNYANYAHLGSFFAGILVCFIEPKLVRALQIKGKINK